MLWLLSSVLKGNSFCVRALARLRELGAATKPGPSTESILNACRQRGIPVLSLDDGLYQLGYGCCQQKIQATITSQTSALAVDTAHHKEATRKLLKAAGLPVPAGRVVSTCGGFNSRREWDIL